MPSRPTEPVAGLSHVVLRTIPSSDDAFATHVARIARAEQPASADAFQVRLRRFYPRIIVRQRELSGEPSAWYVYRDGHWVGGGSDRGTRD
jgi:hypothetical protein